MLRYLFVRRTDWTVLVITCTLSLSLMLLEAIRILLSLGTPPQARLEAAMPAPAA